MICSRSRSITWSVCLVLLVATLCCRPSVAPVNRHLVGGRLGRQRASGANRAAMRQTRAGVGSPRAAHVVSKVAVRRCARAPFAGTHGAPRAKARAGRTSACVERKRHARRKAVSRPGGTDLAQTRTGAAVPHADGRMRRLASSLALVLEARLGSLKRGKRGLKLQVVRLDVRLVLESRVVLLAHDGLQQGNRGEKGMA